MRRTVITVSLIGTLEQYNLSGVLRRVEAHSKTGKFVIKQGSAWVDLYFRGGQLICVGPVRTNANLGERLLQDGLISAHILREVVQATGPQNLSETQMALTFMSLGYLGQEDLRSWAAKKACEVLQVILQWTSGEIYFEEDEAPSTGRLLVGLSITTLLSSLVSVPPAAQPAPAQPVTTVGPAAPKLFKNVLKSPSAPDITRMTTLMNSAQFFGETPAPSPAISELSSSTEALSPILDTAQGVGFASLSGDSEVSFASLSSDSGVSFASLSSDSGVSFASLSSDSDVSFASLSLDDSSPSLSNGIVAPERVMSPVQPPRIDTSFMRPEMLLGPADLSAPASQNQRIQLTPDQWRILTCVNNKRTLQVVSQELAMQPAQVCQVVGELIAMGIVQLYYANMPVPVPGLSNGYAPSGYANTAALRGPALPTSDVMPPQSPQSQPFMTNSMWGNGGNKASFVPGRGWVATPQPLQPLQPSGPLASTGGIYTPAGIVR